MRKARLPMRRLGGVILLTSMVSWGSAAAEPMTLVKGRLIYPSDYMPAQIVCAVSTSNRKRLCTKTKEGDRGFAMRLPPGRYFISAEANGVKAWMTTFNGECGDPCASNEIRAIAVEVDGRDSLDGLCPCDWYTGEANIVFPFD
jgi:hypothetical protein